MHQHVLATESIAEPGAAKPCEAQTKTNVNIEDIRYAAVYNDFTSTLTILLKELGFAKPGDAALRAKW